jgi:hypothetical protein
MLDVGPFREGAAGYGAMDPLPEASPVGPFLKNARAGKTHANRGFFREAVPAVIVHDFGELVLFRVTGFHNSRPWRWITFDKTNPCLS